MSQARSAILCARSAATKAQASRMAVVASTRRTIEAGHPACPGGDFYITLVVLGHILTFRDALRGNAFVASLTFPWERGIESLNIFHG